MKSKVIFENDDIVEACLSGDKSGRFILSDLVNLAEMADEVISVIYDYNLSLCDDLRRVVDKILSLKADNPLQYLDLQIDKKEYYLLFIISDFLVHKFDDINFMLGALNLANIFFLKLDLDENYMVNAYYIDRDTYVLCNEIYTCDKESEHYYIINCMNGNVMIKEISESEYNSKFVSI